MINNSSMGFLQNICLLYLHTNDLLSICREVFLVTKQTEMDLY